MTRAERIMHGAVRDAARYRANPAKFAEDYLHLNLRLFQKILLTMMMSTTTFLCIGSRGIGKSYLSAIFCCVKAILYPESKICIASGTRGQSGVVLEKIMLELVPNSAELRAEIDMKQSRVSGQEAKIVFNNGSYIKIVTASDSSRGNRATVLLLDEFRLIPREAIDLVLKKFLTQRRMPRYSELTNQERAAEYNKEKNITMYLSSAYTVDHWSYQKCESTLKAMLDPSKKQFVCGLPYQLSIAEGLLDPELVADEMLEADFSETKFLMEYGAIWWGNVEDAFFDFNSVAKNRRIKFPMMPASVAGKMSNTSQLRIQPKQPGEIRIISADIALMSSKKNKNDATAIFVNQLLPTKAGRYMSNIVYADSYEGLRTEDQALIIRKLYDEFECDYIVQDTAGLGLGVFDCISGDLTDPESGEIYPALSCCNNQEMADRCQTKGAPKVIWAIKASANFNSECAFLLREGFRSGRIRLLLSEYDAENELSNITGYSKLNPTERLKLQLPYIHTTLLIDELVKLEHEEANGKVRIYERAGMRKDRYSSLAYNYYVACQLENKKRRRTESQSAGVQNSFIFRAPKIR